MVNRTLSHIKLGAFVLAGLILLITLLYMLGRNVSWFGSKYQLRARVENAQGLVSGNNVRYAGIQAGTVKDIIIIDDTTLEVVMFIDHKMLTVIRSNALVSIGTDGLVGNKVINITPVKRSARLAVNGDVLAVKRAIDTDAMLETLNATNQDVSAIAADMRAVVRKLNENNAIWTLLGDKQIPMGIHASVERLRLTMQKADQVVDNVNELIKDTRNGKGTAGMLISDTTIGSGLKQAASHIAIAGKRVDSLFGKVNTMVLQLQQLTDTGKNLMHTLLNDSAAARNLSATLENVRQGTEKFNMSMEALQHNFLLRGYFRKLEKNAKKPVQ